jgi:hypothetical protein
MEEEVLMKTVLTMALLAFAFATAPAIAQVTQSSMPANNNAQPSGVSDTDVQLLRKNIRDQRKQITAQNLQLTPDQSAKFWPLYDQYIAETVKINDQRWALMKSYVEQYQTMTDASASNFVQQSSQIDGQFIALRAKYIPIFEQVISKKQAAQWYQIDRQLDMMINVQLGSMLPLVNPSK